MQKLDILAIGDTTIDVFLTVDPQDSQAVCNLDEEECRISFEYGAKVPVSSMVRIPGVGNAANLAVGSARLGLSSGIYTVLGSDKDSQDSKDVLTEEGVDGTHIVMENGGKSNFSAVLNYSGERTIFVYHELRKYDLPQFESEWVYLTSVGKEHAKLHEQVLEHVARNNTKLAFNPGSYQLLDGVEKLKPVLEKASVLLVNREEAQRLVDGDIEDIERSDIERSDIERSDIEGLFSKLKDTGAETIVITDGQRGSYATHDGREIWHMGVPDTPVVERTGCGDAYSTGFLTAIIKGESLIDAMLWGTMNASSVLQHVGAREGLLTSGQIVEWVEKYKSSLKPKMI
ncbi:MAG: carbohydrate kinase family protein [Patescibacteria group bacterium]